MWSKGREAEKVTRFKCLQNKRIQEQVNISKAQKGLSCFLGQVTTFLLPEKSELTDFLLTALPGKWLLNRNCVIPRSNIISHYHQKWNCSACLEYFILKWLKQNSDSESSEFRGFVNLFSPLHKTYPAFYLAEGKGQTGPDCLLRWNGCKKRGMWKHSTCFCYIVPRNSWLSQDSFLPELWGDHTKSKVTRRASEKPKQKEIETKAVKPV